MSPFRHGIVHTDLAPLQCNTVHLVHRLLRRVDALEGNKPKAPGVLGKRVTDEFHDIDGAKLAKSFL